MSTAAAQLKRPFHGENEIPQKRSNNGQTTSTSPVLTNAFQRLASSLTSSSSNCQWDFSSDPLTESAAQQEVRRTRRVVRASAPSTPPAAASSPITAPTTVNTTDRFIMVRMGNRIECMSNPHYVAPLSQRYIPPADSDRSSSPPIADEGSDEENEELDLLIANLSLSAGST